MSRTMWILLGLLAALSIASIWRDESGMSAPPHRMCKESLFTQIVTGECTLRFDGEKEPS
ncbi:hypothetical protein OAI23_03400 [Alphaproteobacteria bacterium]|nr:hypothetical protein [Alphaproteobacteria bacterium]